MRFSTFREFKFSRKSSSRDRGKHKVVTPLFMQMHMTECGAACLGSVLAYFGRWVPLNELRKRCGVNRDGSSAASIARAARHYGLECTGRSVNAEHLRKMPFPQIIFWEWNHFLILERFDGNRVFLNDPAMGRRKISMKEFVGGFSGITLYFSPRSDFQRGGTPPGILRHLPLYLHGNAGAISFAFGCSFAMALLALIAPVTLGLFVDRTFAGTENWGVAAVAALTGGAALIFVLSYLKEQCINRLAIHMAIVSGDRSVSKLLRLPLEFFSHRLAGDLVDRLISVGKISKSFYKHLVALVIEAAMSLVFLLAMLYYDAVLALVVFGAAVSIIVLIRIVRHFQIDASHMLQREQSMLTSLGILMLQKSDNLRMTASDDSFFQRWTSHQARELSARQRFVEMGHINAAITGMALILSYAGILALGTNQVLASQLTLGSLAAVFVLAGMVLAPLGRIAEIADDWPMIAYELQRLEDIFLTEKDARFSRRQSVSGATPTLNGQLKLSGHVELRDITFGYSENHPLIKNFNMTIKPGQRVALIGPSGSGKSALASLVTGAYAPWSGEIRFDGRLREEIPDEVMIRSLSLVEQEPVLFSATIRENITLWNPAVPDSAIVAAARDACIHKRILERPGGYSAAVDENGGNFSGGERQRLEIARALVGNPTVLVLDEATSALDAVVEREVDDALRRRGVSCLIIAHRLSTIRDCDEIIVLDQSVAVQRGTHDELISDTQGLYFKLVSAG